MTNSQSEWYVFKEKQHLGPFPIEGLLKLYAEGKIAGDSMLWRPGETGWRPLSNIEEVADVLRPDLEYKTDEHLLLSDRLKERERLLLEKPMLEKTQTLVKAPPPPPSLIAAKSSGPHLESQFIKDKKVHAPKAGNNPEGQVKIPTKEKSLTQKQLTKNIPELKLESDLSLLTGPKETIKKSKRGLTVAVLAMGLLAIALLSFSFLMAQKRQAPVESFSLVPPIEMGRLKQISNQVDSAVVKTGWFKLNGSEIVAAINRQGEGVAHLKLSSLENKIIGEGEVAASAVGLWEGRSLHFRQFSFLKGKEILNGQYKIELELRAEGPNAALLSALNQTGLFHFIPIVRTFIKTMHYEGVHFLGVKSDAEFKKSLGEFLDKKRPPPIPNEMGERFSTLSSLIARTKILFIEKLARLERPEHFRLFEAEYGAQVAPMLQELILEAVKKSQEVGPYQSSYQSLLTLGKDLGALVATMAEQIALKKSFDEKTRSDFKERFTSELTPLLLRAELEVENTKNSNDQINARIEVP